MTMLFFASIDGQMLQTVLICIDLHQLASTCMVQFQRNDLISKINNISFNLYAGYFSKVHMSQTIYLTEVI